MKTCTRCGVLKPLSDYSKESASKDGRQYACKECQMHYNRNYRNDPNNVKRAKSITNPIKQLKAVKDYASRNPDRIKARNALNYAVYRGRIVRPAVCSSCGFESKVQAHHPNYAKPLEVEWLCTKCHGVTRRPTIPIDVITKEFTDYNGRVRVKPTSNSY